MQSNSIKSILYQNITNEGVSIDLLYRIIEREGCKRATGEKKLRDLAREDVIDTQRRDKNGLPYWETIHTAICNDTVIGYRRKFAEIKFEVKEKKLIPMRLFQVKQIFNN
jgi:hypothetical protein